MAVAAVAVRVLLVVLRHLRQLTMLLAQVALEGQQISLALRQVMAAAAAAVQTKTALLVHAPLAVLAVAVQAVELKVLLMRVL
jgi:hypothetical protein